jgi:hypothetical protein
MEFPFEVPVDLTSLSADEFSTFQTQVREYAEGLLQRDDVDPDHLVATRDLFSAVQAEDARRQDAAAAVAAARDDLTGALASEPTPSPEPTPAPNQNPDPPASTLDSPPDPDPADLPVVMVASSDAPGAVVGNRLDTFRDAVDILSRRLDTYSGSVGTGRKVPRVGRNAYRFGGRSVTRHGAVAFQRKFPDDLTITDSKNALAVLDHATGERRLPGGSLRESVKAAVKSGRALTAAVGWCAPSETLYDLCELETVDGILDIPEVQAARGGFFLPEDGGPNFAAIYDGIGNQGDVILTEYEIENDAVKVCYEIPCPDFVEVRLDAVYACLTGSLLQQRGYPEVVARFTRGAMVALAHKINQSVIARIVAASGAATVIPTIVGSDDAASQLLSAVELAIEDIKYRNRMGRGSTIEIVLPAWVIAPIRAALARRQGVAAINVTDMEIIDAFTSRSAIPRFVYDWQDAFSGLATGPGGAAALTALPTSVQFLAYPAGTWSKAVRSVVNLDTVYDSAGLTANQYTALFVEDGLAVLQMCPESRLYESGLDPDGIVGCCEYTS